MYLALGGGPPRFKRDSSCPALLGVTSTSSIAFRYGALTLSGRPFHAVPVVDVRPCGGLQSTLICPATLPAQRLQAITRRKFGLFPVRSPLLRESLLFSLPRGTEMFQFPRCPSYSYGFTAECHLITDGGFPHSDTPGSQPAYGSPRHFGVRPVLRRHLTPRHPPCALITLSYAASDPRRISSSPAVTPSVMYLDRTLPLSFPWFLDLLVSLCLFRLQMRGDLLRHSPLLARSRT